MTASEISEEAQRSECFSHSDEELLCPAGLCARPADLTVFIKKERRPHCKERPARN